MTKELTKLQKAQLKAEQAAEQTNIKINEMGQYTKTMHGVLIELQQQFDLIRNIPSEQQLEYEEIKATRVKWEQQVQEIIAEHERFEMQALGQGAAGVGAGLAVMSLGPTAAMGVATTFGVASTGTAISTLSGAAATNAALAWLGGGALAAGGGGITAGNAFLALAGPVGWAVAGVSIAASGFVLYKKKKEMEILETLYTLISQRDAKSYELAIVELSERIVRIIEETDHLDDAVVKIKNLGSDYGAYTEEQKYELAGYFNFMKAATALLVNPIEGLQPKFTEEDLDSYYEYEVRQWEMDEFNVIPSSLLKSLQLSRRKTIMQLATMLYKIDLDEETIRVLTKSLRKNKEFLNSIESSKESFDENEIKEALKALEYKYAH